MVLGRFIDLRYRASHANQVVYEVTARSGPNGYVDATQDVKDGIAQLASQGGGILFFGPGKFFIQETIVVPSGITIEGSGSGYVGQTLIILGNNSTLNGSGMALFSVASSVAIKDVNLMSMTAGPNYWPRTDASNIANENTTAIRIENANGVGIENVRISYFTYGIYAGSSQGVSLKSVTSVINTWALKINSTNARDWDVQNLNAVEMYSGQSGVSLEQVGNISFLQLSCASTNHDAALCIDIGQRAGDVHITEAHVEGPQQGFKISAGSTHPVYIENSAMGGVVEQQSVIYSFANRFDSTSSAGRINFVGTGMGSTLYKCGDVFTNGYPEGHVSYVPQPALADQYPGLTNIPAGCNFKISDAASNFSTGMMPFQAFNWITNNTSTISNIINVKNFGAVGDGVTDDTAAFLAALQNNAEIYWSSSTIVVPEGTYKITQTLPFHDGLSFKGEGNATISYTGSGALFQLRATANEELSKGGIGVQGLTLTGSSSATAIDMTGNGGNSTSMNFTNLHISGFGNGITAHNDNGQFDNTQPEFDSIAIRNIEFSNVGTAIETHDNNASNWNIENISITGMSAGQIGLKFNGGGNFAVRNLTCQGSGEACYYLSRHAGVYIDNMISTGNKYAFYGEWALGWTPYPVIIKNSNLRDGFYTAGRIYLVSSGNTFAYGGSNSPVGSQSTFFNSTGTDDSQNVFPGDSSTVYTCEDVFKNPSGTVSGSLVFTGLTNAATSCTYPAEPTPTPTPTPSVTPTPTPTPSVTPTPTPTPTDEPTPTPTPTPTPSVTPTPTPTPTEIPTPTPTPSPTPSPTPTPTPTPTPATPDFACSADNYKVIFVGTSSASYVVGASVFSGFNSSIDVEVVSGLPSGASATTATLTSPYYASSIVLTTTNVSAGVYNFTFGFTGGGITHYCSSSLEVISIEPTPTPTPTPSITPTPTPSITPTPTPTFVPTPTPTPTLNPTPTPTPTPTPSITPTPTPTHTPTPTPTPTSGGSGGGKTNPTPTPTPTKIAYPTPTPTPTPTQLLANNTNFMCPGNQTIFLYYKNQREAYPELAVYEAWNGKSFASVQHISQDLCNQMVGYKIVRMPEGSLVKVAGGKEIYRIEGNTARPFTSYDAYKRDAINKVTYTVSVFYLHTYPRGANIY